MKKLLFLFTAVLVGLGISYVYSQNSTKNQTSTEMKNIPTTTPELSSTPSLVMEKTYSLEEIAKHKTKDDCWFVVERNVYDVTKFIASNKHPGKDAILEGCGKDATVLFNTRPMGSGTPHSDKAKTGLSNFKIGLLE